MDPQLLLSFQQAFESATAPAEKLQLVNQHIRQLVEQTQPGIPLSTFWKLREHSTPLFAQEIASQISQELWNEYRQLCQEFRRIRALADEQAQFAAEQIQITVKALEEQVLALEGSDIVLEDLPLNAQSVQEHLFDYQAAQKELNLLNIYATRITTLRKELANLEMRPRLKHRLFQELSLLGERIFPRRKELIKVVSQLFCDDIQHFIDHFFPLGARAPIFQLREEIKELQACAKLLTLNTAAFTQTREQLAHCWEELREAIRQKRAFEQERRQQDQVHLQDFEQRFQELLQAIAEERVTEFNFEEHQRDLCRSLDQLPIHRNEKKSAKDRVFEAVAPLIARAEEQSQALKAQAELAERARQERVAECKRAIDTTLANSAGAELESLFRQYEELQAMIGALVASKTEKIALEKNLRPLKELIAEAKERALLHLSEDDLQVLQQLRVVLQQRLERRKELKSHIEELRRGQSSGTLTFEKALVVHEQIQEEKERLEKLDQSIREIEEKIAEFAAKI